MKWKFSLPGNLELKFCWDIYTKITKVIPEAFLGDFLLKIGIIWYRDIRKDIPFYKYEGPPLATPTIQHHRIMEYMRFYENAWLGFRYYTFLHMFCVRLHTNFILELPKWPYFNYIKLVYGFLNTPLQNLHKMHILRTFCGNFVHT